MKSYSAHYSLEEADDGEEGVLVLTLENHYQENQIKMFSVSCKVTEWNSSRTQNLHFQYILFYIILLF